jgi:hypothetical protein
VLRETDKQRTRACHHAPALESESCASRILGESPVDLPVQDGVFRIGTLQVVIPQFILCVPGENVASIDDLLPDSLEQGHVTGRSLGACTREINDVPSMCQWLRKYPTTFIPSDSESSVCTPWQYGALTPVQPVARSNLL